MSQILHWGIIKQRVCFFLHLVNEEFIVVLKIFLFTVKSSQGDAHGDWYSFGRSHDSPDPTCESHNLYLEGAEEVNLYNKLIYLKNNMLYKRELGQYGDVSYSLLQKKILPKIAKICAGNHAIFLLSTKGEGIFLPQLDGFVDRSDELKSFAPIFDIRCSGDTYWFKNEQGYFCMTDQERK